MMLDSYIIDRIRREREINREQGVMVPLRIRVPEDRPETPPADRKEERERGSTDIDFLL